MKKIIIAMCGLLIAGEAVAKKGTPDKLQSPTAQYATYWLKSDAAYDTQLNGFYTKFAEQIGENNRNGTFNDEGMVIIWAARKIYKNGAMICPVQIQAANENGYKSVWLDYYWKTNNNAWGCVDLCRPGWSGNNCETNEQSCYSSNNSENILGNLPDTKSLWYSTNTQEGNKWNNRHTTAMQVLYIDNEIDEKNESGEPRETRHIVLGVVQKMDHGVMVAPIRIKGERHRRNISGLASWIKEVKSDGQTILLCQDGYAANSTGDDCIQYTTCTGTEGLKQCEGFTKFDPEKHTSFKVGDCRKYKCTDPTQGFVSDSNHDCIACDTTIKSGINKNGECEKCATGKCFNTSTGECGGCIEIPKLKIERGPNYDSQNRECWRKTNADKFWGCVMCPDENQCYNKNSSGKYECGTCPTE